MKTLFGTVGVPSTVEPRELIPPTVQEGYQTVAGWWATEDLEALKFLEEPLATIISDGEELLHLAEERGVSPQWGDACAALQKLGFATEAAFPLDLLSSFYPANP